MENIWRQHLQYERMVKARRKAMEDPRVQEIQKKITELTEQKEKLIDSIEHDIYKEMIGS